MSEYQKYQHVEKLGTDEVDGILEGRCYVFPKLDGTNAQVWFDGESIRCGSRRRELSLEDDNAGFMAAMLADEAVTSLAKKHPTFRFFGEWLVPHSLKTYKDDAWRRFYIFDVLSADGKHVPYDEYKPWLDEFGVNYVPPIRIIKNPSYENIVACLNENTMLIKDGSGVGEGVVIKNYEFTNRYGRQTWAKVVTSEFKEKHAKEMGPPECVGDTPVEEKIVKKFLTAALMDKVKANIVTDGGWSSRSIPRLIHTVYYDFVREHTWDFVKEFKNPTVDYKKIMRFVQIETKRHFKELF